MGLNRGRAISYVLTIKLVGSEGLFHTMSSRTHTHFMYSECKRTHVRLLFEIAAHTNTHAHIDTLHVQRVQAHSRPAFV